MEKIQFLYKTFQRLKKRVLKEDKIREYINNYRVGKLSQIRKKALFSKKKLTNMSTLKLRILFISGDHKESKNDTSHWFFELCFVLFRST